MIDYYYIIYFLCLIYFYFLLRKWIKGPKANPTNMSGKVVIITGSSSGLGKQSAFELLKNGATVIFACRDMKKTLSVIEECKKLTNNVSCNTDPYNRAVYMQLELSNFASVLSFSNAFKKKFDKLDILMNNAGYIATNFELSEDGLEKMIQTNHYSHVMLTLLLIDKLIENGRIINISSITHLISNYSTTLIKQFPKGQAQYQKEINGSFYSPFVSYGNTKLANIYFSQYLENYFSNSQKFKNIKIFACHPGIVSTEFLRFLGNGLLYKVLSFFYKFISKTEYDGAQTQLHLCYEDLSKLISGGYYGDCSLKTLSNSSKNKILRDFLMSETIKEIKEFLEKNSYDFKYLSDLF